MHPSTNQRGECLETATAISLWFAALDQHQMKADAARGNTRRGSRRLTPAVVRCVDDMQDRLAPCKAGFDLLVTGRGRRGSGPFSQFSFAPGFLHPLSDKRAFRGSSLLPDHRGARTHSLRGLACQPTVRNSLPNQHFINRLADWAHLSEPFQVRCSDDLKMASEQGQGIGTLKHANGIPRHKRGSTFQGRGGHD